MAKTSPTSAGRFSRENRQNKQQSGKASYSEIKTRADGFQISRTQQWKDQYREKIAQEKIAIQEKRAALYLFFAAQQTKVDCYRSSMCDLDAVKELK